MRFDLNELFVSGLLIARGRGEVATVWHMVLAAADQAPDEFRRVFAEDADAVLAAPPADPVDPLMWLLKHNFAGMPDHPTMADLRDIVVPNSWSAARDALADTNASIIQGLRAVAEQPARPVKVPASQLAACRRIVEAVRTGDKPVVVSVGNGIGTGDIAGYLAQLGADGEGCGPIHTLHPTDDVRPRSAVIVHALRAVFGEVVVADYPWDITPQDVADALRLVADYVDTPHLVCAMTAEAAVDLVVSLDADALAGIDLVQLPALSADEEEAVARQMVARIVATTPNAGVSEDMVDLALSGAEGLHGGEYLDEVAGRIRGAIDRANMHRVPRPVAADDFIPVADLLQHNKNRR